ncbi:MAG: hypothetical protein KGQ66_06335 [Acidobacteriota bacterium]|nr:hypothetical protein [Acidobacteriota bacterium]
MLLLATLVLVVASAVFLIIGFVVNSLGLIYLSMLCAGVAALALLVFARLSRRHGSGAEPPANHVVAVGSERIGAGSDPGPGFPSYEPVGVGGAAVADAGSSDWVAAAEKPRVAERPAAEAGAQGGSGFGRDDVEDWGEDVVFPIAGYDGLRVVEIVPHLGRLTPGELRDVRDREMAGKRRTTVLERIDDRLKRMEAAAGGGRAREGAAATEPGAPQGPASPVVPAPQSGGPGRRRTRPRPDPGT